MLFLEMWYKLAGHSNELYYGGEDEPLIKRSKWGKTNFRSRKVLIFMILGVKMLDSNLFYTGLQCKYNKIYE